MRVNKITDWVYNFEDVLPINLFMALSDMLTNAEGYHTNDVRPGNTKMFVKDPQVFAILLHLREKLFEQVDELNGPDIDWNPLEFKWCNALAKGPVNDAHWHTDGGPRELMIVFYFHHNWKAEWNGKLQFENVELYPKPNSAVIFPAELHHRIEPASMTAEEWRRTVTFPTEVTQASWTINVKDVQEKLSKLEKAVL